MRSYPQQQLRRRSSVRRLIDGSTALDFPTTLAHRGHSMRARRSHMFEYSSSDDPDFVLVGAFNLGDCRAGARASQRRNRFFDVLERRTERFAVAVTKVRMLHPVHDRQAGREQRRDHFIEEGPAWGDRASVGVHTAFPSRAAIADDPAGLSWFRGESFSYAYFMPVCGLMRNAGRSLLEYESFGPHTVPNSG
jgi:hypothetical protein